MQRAEMWTGRVERTINRYINISIAMTECSQVNSFNPDLTTS